MRCLIVFFYLLWTVFATAQPAETDVRPIVVAPPDYSSTLLESVYRAHREITEELSRKLGFSLPVTPTIVICADHDAMEKAARSELPDWALGVALPRRYLIGVNSARIDMLGNNILAVIRHEMCHLYLGAWENEARRSLPLWFNEGICEWYSRGLHINYPETIMDSAASDQLIPLHSLRKKFPEDSNRAAQAYGQSLSIVKYIVGTYGEKALARILSSYVDSRDFTTAVESALGIPLATLEEQWQASVRPSHPWLWRIARFFSYLSLFSIVAWLVLLAYWRQRRRARKILARWDEEERVWETVPDWDED